MHDIIICQDESPIAYMQFYYCVLIHIISIYVKKP